MQMEISCELDHADFARFEREILGNEVIGARAEINMLRDERTLLLKRLDLNRENITQLMETEEQTYKTLMVERATTEGMIRALKNKIRELKTEQHGAQGQITSLTNNMERAEKARVAAVLYAKGAEDRVVEVANRQKQAASSPPAPPANPTIPFWPAADDEALKNKLKDQMRSVKESDGPVNLC
ncbi:hypothetical protein PGT21_037256 [Puccinia graminis f. sp. tritici]|uniref:Uncharacterized protein n=1 Tax=Puccinia graminis f. sp. tritici TaxID=56615 RepID=A0A5B0R479_PUCGR|nr:hypothetical protein PGT21_037256 [Puccinia graminis f. sp. tritici]